MGWDIDAMRRGAEAPERAGLADLPSVAEDLAAAFSTDELFTWFSRADGRADAARTPFFLFVLREMAFGVGEIMRPATGGAAAVWAPSEKVGPNPLLTELRAVPVILALTGWSRFGRLAKQRAAMEKHHPTDRPHDYLMFLGVSPGAQGHGVGSRLLKARTERLDARGRPAFLETATEANVRLYNRHGFEVISEYRPAPDGPLNWAMWREPQPLA